MYFALYIVYLYVLQALKALFFFFKGDFGTGMIKINITKKKKKKNVEKWRMITSVGMFYTVT